jgi:hypothetical protein
MAHYFVSGIAMSSVVLNPVAEAGYWRVKIAWPNKTPHYFGKFQNKKEAEKWIEQHHWMTEQREEPNIPPEEST